MKKYYETAIELNDINAMSNLGYYYSNIDEERTNTEKYYNMAIDRGDVYTMYLYGRYFENLKDYANMKKYLLMASDGGNKRATERLELYKRKEQKEQGDIKLL